MAEDKKDREGTSDRQKTVAVADVFWTFFRIGMFTLGGGLAMSSVMRHELVIRRRWVDATRFFALMSLATVVPGVIAVNIAYLLGRRLRGTTGAAAAVLGTVLPSFLVILLVAGIFLPFFDHPKVAAFFRGCTIAVVGQLAFSVFVFGRKLLRRWQHFLICGVGLAIVGSGGLHPIFGIIGAGVAGYWLCPRDRAPGENSHAAVD